MFADLALWLWVSIGVQVAKVIAPSRAAELDRLRCAIFSNIKQPEHAVLPCGGGTDSSQTVTGVTPSNLNVPGSAAGPRRLTCDLAQGDQDPELLAATSISAIPKATSCEPNMELCLGTCETPSASAVEELREHPIRVEDYKNTTPEMRNILGLLLRSNEDNAVLKSALLTTLAKLQSARNELQATKAELHITQEQAHLLLEERESACFSEADGTTTPDEQSSDARGDIKVRRSLNDLLVALENLRSGQDDNVPGGSLTSSLEPTTLAFRSDVECLPKSQPAIFCNQASPAPSSNASPMVDGVSTCSPLGRQPTVHRVPGVLYRVSPPTSA